MQLKSGSISVVMSVAGLAVLVLLVQAQVPAGMGRAAQAQAAQAGRAGAVSAAPAPSQTSESSSAAPPTTTAPRATAPRRDPFRPLISFEKSAEAIPARLPAGKPGLVIGQLTIQGIVRNIDGKWMAVVDNKTKRSYFLYERDELYNGVVTSITGDSVTFEERSIDAAGRQRTREIVKRVGGV